MHAHITYLVMNNLNTTVFDSDASSLSNTSCYPSSDLDSVLFQSIGQRAGPYLSPKALETAANGSVAVSLILSVAFLVRSLAFLVEKAGD